MKSALLFAFTLVMAFACGGEVPGINEDCLLIAEGRVSQSFDESKAYIRLKNNTDYSFSEVKADFVGGDLTYTDLSSGCLSIYQETIVEIAVVTGTIKYENSTIMSPPAGFFGTTLKPGLYTCIIFLTEEGYDRRKMLNLSHTADRLF